MKNKLKTLLQTKQKTISRERGYPSQHSGRDGDFQVRKIDGQGIFLFYKWHNKWYSSRLTQYRPRTSEHKQPVKIPLGVEPSSLGDIAMDSDGLIKVKKSKSNKSQMVSMNTSNLLDIAEIKAERNTTTDMSATAAGTSDLHLLNKTGYTYMLLETQGSSYDPFIVYGYRQAGESIELKQWVTGMDNSNSDTFCIYYKSGDNAPLTPSTTTASHKKFEIDISGNVTTLGTLTIGSITETTSDTNKFLVSDGGEVKYVDDDTLIPDILTAGTNCTLSGSTLNVDDAFLVNNAADIMAVSDFGANAALKIDADQPATAGAEDSVGLWIDYDRIVAGSGTAAHNDIGIDLDVNSASLGTSTVKGMDIDVVGATSGTHVATGIDLNVSGADTNVGLDITSVSKHIILRASADPSNDYSTFTLADTGDLTISTTGNGTTDSDITLNADGTVKLDAANSGIYFYDNGTLQAAIDTGGSFTNFYMFEDGGASTDDYLVIKAGVAGSSSIETKDNAGADGHLSIAADGQLILSSANSAGTIADGTLFRTGATTFGSITTHHALSCFTLFEAGGSSTDDYFTITTDAAGATTISTVDAGGATGHLTINPDGDIVLDSPVKLPTGTKLYLDGGADTYIVEESADLVSFYVGNAALLGLAEDATTSTAQSSKLYAGCPILLKDVGGAADTPNSGYGSIYVNGDTLYFKDDGGNVSNITAINPIVSAMIFG